MKNVNQLRSKSCKKSAIVHLVLVENDVTMKSAGFLITGGLWDWATTQKVFLALIQLTPHNSKFTQLSWLLKHFHSQIRKMQSAGEKKKEKAADAEPSMDLADTEALINSVSILCALLLAFTVPMISKTNYNGA
jgi:hypothetical protein